MSPLKDPEIKLFGTMIPLPDFSDHFPISKSVKDAFSEETHEVSLPGVKEEPARPNRFSGVKSGKDENETTIEDNKSAVDPKHDEEKMETNAASGEQKVLRKMDKILSCPRCNSMDTKFCYYNNYNVNQPRHFCKNCQRYWTAGGATRNVPVGAGRRKNKHSASHYHHIVMSSDGIPTAHVETPDLASHQVLPCRLSGPTEPVRENGTVLKFGPHVPFFESMETVLNLGDKKTKIEQRSVACSGNGDEPSCGSTVTAASYSENELPENVCRKEQGAKPVCCNMFPPHHLQGYPGHPLFYPWSPGWNNVGAMAASWCSSELVYEQENGNSGLVQRSSPRMVASPAFCPPTIPLPFVPASYWGAMPGWAGGSWNAVWTGSKSTISPSLSTRDSGCSGNDSATLGKHSRDANLTYREKTEKCLWVPKTLRIDDPDEVAKSSIRSTLGIKLDPNEPATQGGTFKAFQPKMEGKGHSLDAKQILQANPAALSRSQMFQESV